MPTWPASLSQRPLIDGFVEMPPNLVVRSQTDLGPAKVRRRATASMTRFQMTLRMTAPQLATFRTFLADDLDDRARSFTWVHPITGAAGTFRIVDPPSIVPAGNAAVSWRVALVVELLP